MQKTLFLWFLAVFFVMLARLGSAADYTFTDQTPVNPLISGDQQRYLSLVGNGTNLGLWYENRTAGGIDMRTSTAGYTGFGSSTATSGLSGLTHPKIYETGGGNYAGFFWDSTQSPPNGIKKLTSTDGVTWGAATQIVVNSTAFPAEKIWGVVGYFEDLSGTTDVLYYTQATGANEKVYRATATDGVNFTYQGTAFENPGGSYGAGISVGSQVRYDAVGSQFLLIWSGESTVGNIGYAVSADGLTFTNLGAVITSNAGHTDLQESSFVTNGSSIVGVYTGDFNGITTNHIGAFTGSVVVPEPGTLVLVTLGSLLCLARQRRTAVA